jgi:hypothetical protein
LGDRGYRVKGEPVVYFAKYRFVAGVLGLFLPPFLHEAEYPIGFPNQEASRLEAVKAP